MDKIAKRIENCRRHLNFSQSELARKVGVTPQAVQKWEKAKTVPRGYTLENWPVCLVFHRLISSLELPMHLLAVIFP